MLDQEAMENLAALIKGLKGDDPKLLAAALAKEGTCLRCKGTFKWGKGVDVLKRTITCPHCGAEIVSF
jgi:DNA-directed RNA polymerase subunit RPC12/RpoP